MSKDDQHVGITLLGNNFWIATTLLLPLSNQALIVPIQLRFHHQRHPHILIKIRKKTILVSHMRPLKFISAPQKARHFVGQLWHLMTALNVGAWTQAWQLGQLKVGGLQNPGVCLQAFPSFLPHPLNALLFTPFFAQSLTIVPCSLLLNRTEMLATQATLASSWPFNT